MNYCPECGAKLAGKRECECGFVVPEDAEPTGTMPSFPSLTPEYYRNAAINLGFIKPGDDYFMIPNGTAAIPDDDAGQKN